MNGDNKYSTQLIKLMQSQGFIERLLLDQVIRFTQETMRYLDAEIMTKREFNYRKQTFIYYLN